MTRASVLQINAEGEYLARLLAEHCFQALKSWRQEVLDVVFSCWRANVLAQDVVWRW
jgi:hypothetical protein